MTIAISLKVNEGLVLAADSASTVMAKLPNGDFAVLNVYNNANKVFNLIKGSPIGAITWGSGAIGECSISMLMKDLRKKLTDPADTAFYTDPNNYQVSDVVDRLKTFIFDGHYSEAFSEWPNKPDLGFVIGGYSTGDDLAEEYQLGYFGGSLLGPTLLRPKNITGATWNGQIEAPSRLVIGYSPLLPSVLATALGQDEAKIRELLNNSANPALNPQLVQGVMPLQDAVDLATFLVDVSIQFARFSPGASTVGGAIEVAAISKHEGFKWIERKHYFGSEFNPTNQYEERNVS